MQLYAGLVLYGVSMALMVRSSLGVMPWDVLHQGLSRQLGWSLGTVTIVVGALVLLAWVPLRERPGLGTLSNVVVVTGWLLGGTLGVVTVLYALSIGPLVHLLLPRFALDAARGRGLAGELGLGVGLEVAGGGFEGLADGPAVHGAEEGVAGAGGMEHVGAEHLALAAEG